MSHRFRLVAALNVALWLVTLVLPLAATINVARATDTHVADPVHWGCQLTAADDDLSAKRNGKRKLPPLAPTACDRGPVLLIGLPVRTDEPECGTATRPDLAERSQTATARYTVLFEACGPPARRPIV
jgi:hypothetical protein